MFFHCANDNADMLIRWLFVNDTMFKDKDTLVNYFYGMARGKVGLYGLGRWAIGRRPDPLLQPCCHPATATLTSVQNH